MCVCVCVCVLAALMGNSDARRSQQQADQQKLLASQQWVCIWVKGQCLEQNVFFVLKQILFCGM